VAISHESLPRLSEFSVPKLLRYGMSGCNTNRGLAVHSLVKTWMNVNQPDVEWSVFEDQQTMQINIHVLLPGDTQQKILKPHQANNLMDSGIQVEIESWLANLCYPKSGVEQ
jgi:hypothetical protein